jgi:hypothetical protein
MVAASAMNPGGCDGIPVLGCFAPGGTAVEYSIDVDSADGKDCRYDNISCAKLVARFNFGDETIDH